jgi:hypothetical protein
VIIGGVTTANRPHFAMKSRRDSDSALGSFIELALGSFIVLTSMSRPFAAFLLTPRDYETPKINLVMISPTAPFVQPEKRQSCGKLALPGSAWVSLPDRHHNPRRDKAACAHPDKADR